MSKECSICCETFNKSNRKIINCKTCEDTNTLVCQSCAKRYILDQPTDASCMVCKIEWDSEFLKDNFPDNFINKELKTHRENYLLEKQLAILPETQEYAEQIKLVEGLEKQRQIIYTEKRELENKIKQHNIKIREINDTIYSINHGSYKNKEKSEFTFKCPIEHCNGFLNEKFHCGICDNNICKHCMEIKEENHECDEEKKETVKLLRQDTKPCPKCGQLIHKLPNGCFAKDTPILMWDGTVKLSQDIKVGDNLIGDDGNIRTVLNLVSGVDDMYIIKQNNAEDYTVNSKHILTFYFASNGSIKIKKNSYVLTWYDKNNYCIKTNSFKNIKDAELFKSNMNIDEKTIDIPLENYLKLSDSNKKILKGLKLENSINWDNKHIELDPYVLGLWIGDGYSNGKEFCTNDKQILDYWYKWCDKNNAVIIKRNDNFRYYVKNKDNNNNDTYFPNRNPLKEKLEKYDLINNKHIPNQYLINSKEIRLKLLAGLIDTDGCVQNNGRRIIIITVIEKLSKNIEFLANSLGYSVNITIREKKNVKCPNTEPKDYKDQFNINISGKNIDEIPTLLNHKKCSSQQGITNLRTTGIEIVKIDKSEYYGWDVNDNKRFLLKDFTIVHNCDQMYCVKCHTAFSWRTGQLERGTIHNPEYYRWMRENGKNIPRNPLDVPYDPCGNQLIQYTQLIRIVRIYFPSETETRYRDRYTTGFNRVKDQIQTIKIANMHRMIGHIEHLNNIFNNDLRHEESEIRKMRAYYILNNLTRDEFKRKLQMIEKKKNKSKKINDIWNLIRLVLIEYIGKITERNYDQNDGKKIINDIINESEKIRKYSNKQFAKIGKIFKMVYPGINHDWIQINNWEAYIKQQQISSN